MIHWENGVFFRGRKIDSQKKKKYNRWLERELEAEEREETRQKWHQGSDAPSSWAECPEGFEKVVDDDRSDL